MGIKSSCQRVTLAYPKHRFKPTDLLDFIESTDFTSQWSEMGFNDDDDLCSLQMCIMVHPHGDGEIEGTGVHYLTYVFRHEGKAKRITVYYGFFQDYGIIYLCCFDESDSVVDFSQEQRVAMKTELEKVFSELQRLKTIRVGRK